MNKREVQNAIFSRMGQLLKETRFRLFKSEDGFFRKIPSGRQYIGVPIVDYGGSFKFSVVLGIRLDAVEDIANRFNRAPPKYHSSTQTFIGRVDRLFPQQNTEFVVVASEDLESSLVRLAPMIRQQVLTFLDYTKDLKTVAVAMELKNIPDVVASNAHAIRVVTVAWMTKSPDFEAIVSTYEDKMELLPSPFKDDFKDAVSHLRNKVEPVSF